ncbi:MAG: DUF2306 domain-containing protein [Bacteroidetes bacterium]|nr:DUF2306 domain-containing protein [Bacteroidota bacterium]
MKQRVGKFIQALLLFTTLSLVVSLSINAFTYANFDFKYSFLRLKQEAITTGWYLPAYYSHVLIAGLILLAGFFQVNSRLSLGGRRLHRAIGYVYAYGIFFFAAPGGLVMSFFIDRGPVVLLSFVLQTIAWVWFTAVAVYKAKMKDISRHRKWMLRSYAITFAAVSLRVYTFVFTGSIDLMHPLSYGLIAWASWVVNLIGLEVYFYFRNNDSVFQSTSKR